jgi:hypothetical protein
MFRRMSRADDIKGQIGAAWADLPIPQGQLVWPFEGDLERDEYEADLRGLHWRDVPVKTVVRHCDILAYLRPEACRYYLPSYMVATLDDPGSNAGLFYFHVTSPAFRDALPLYTKEQVAAIRAVLEYLNQGDPSGAAELERDWKGIWA